MNRRAVLCAVIVAGSSLLCGPASAQPSDAPTAIKTSDAPLPIGPFSQAVSVGPLVYLSGQIGLDPATGQLVTGGTDVEARRAMANLGAVLKAAGLTFGNVVKTTIYLTDITDFGKVNAAYAEFFTSGTPPARATVGVASLVRGAHVEIEMVAVRQRY
jgi:2-iminobutanoate/2-iminopropanoate deaminase